MKQAKILYFVSGPAPTAEQLAEANEMSATVVFRNALAVPAEQHSLEICDGVAGDVPQLYAEEFPTAEDAINAKAAELKSLSDKVGDEPAPKGLTAAQAKAAKKEQAALAAANTANNQTGKTSAPVWNGGN